MKETIGEQMIECEVEESDVVTVGNYDMLGESSDNDDDEEPRWGVNTWNEILMLLDTHHTNDKESWEDDKTIEGE